MTVQELKRREIARFVFKKAWHLKQQTELFRLRFASSLKISWLSVRGRLGRIHTKVRGCSFGRRQETLKWLYGCNQKDVILSLERDIYNPFDSNAIQVMVTLKNTGLKAPIGFLSKELAAGLTQIMDAGGLVFIIDWQITGASQLFYGCNLCIGTKKERLHQGA